MADETAQQVLYKVKVLHSSETEVCMCPSSVQVREKDYVIVPTKYGKDLGYVQGQVENDFEEDEVKEIVRLASNEDIEEYESNKEREHEALRICQEKADARGLEMKLVSAHYLMEESKVLFFFTAEARVDFRELVKDLVSIFKMRIELRQIGVRDESRVLGGMGVCGRTFCCHNVTDKLKPVSIKMAKEQNLSLNSMKISGPCGRLLCCLAYEFDFYNQTKRNLPNEGNKLTYKNVVYRIIDINIISKRVRLIGDDGSYQDLPLSRIYFCEKAKQWKISDEENENDL
jgi:cell fate regulator YaaT (PSP1 superfamily)